MKLKNNNENEIWKKWILLVLWLRLLMTFNPSLELNIIKPLHFSSEAQTIVNFNKHKQRCERKNNDEIKCVMLII